MGKRHRRVHARTPQGDRKGAVAYGDDRLDETTDGRLQLVDTAVTRPARSNLSRRDCRAVGETGTLSQGEDPGTSVRIEPPGCGEAGSHTSIAVHSNQRFVELTEQQSLAVVGRARCIRRIDAVAEGNGGNRLARFSNQRAIGESCL